MRNFLRDRRQSRRGNSSLRPGLFVCPWMTHRFSGRLCLQGAMLAIVLFSASALCAEGTSETITLRAVTDAWPIHITYFPAKAKDSGVGSSDAGVVILLHGQGGDRLVWEQKHGNATQSIAGMLQSQGFAVVSVDLRKHGESTRDGESGSVLRNADYQQMWLGDLEAVKQFLLEEHQKKKLNINKLAIVSADETAPIAARYAVYDWNKRPYDDAPATSPEARTPRGQDVRALVFLSPSNTAGNINIMSSIKSLRDPRARIAMLVLVGQKDRLNSGTTKNIEQVMKAADRDGERTFFQTFPEVKFRGTDLLGKPNIKAEIFIVRFLEKFISELDSPWRDRRSRLDR